MIALLVVLLGALVVGRRRLHTDPANSGQGLFWLSVVALVVAAYSFTVPT